MNLGQIRSGAVGAILMVGLVMAACGGGPDGDSPGSNIRATSHPPLATTPAPVEPVSPVAQAGTAKFRGTIRRIPRPLAARMRGGTWRPGCPVPIRELRLLTLSYWGFDGQVHRGPMVVNARVAKGIEWVFRRLFRARFPIEDMALARPYRPKLNPNPNTRASITDGFNCRVVVTAAGPGAAFSMHSYGLAVDVNSLQNPYVTTGGRTGNRFARQYVDRSKHLPGMIREGDVVVRAFRRIGWQWGGNWPGDKDYMHFSANGH